MKITLVSIAAAKAAREAGAHELTPEMLAAVAARYSRNGEGLEAILGKVAGMDPEKAVDSVFNMLDYGHQSIAGMVPVPIFMDGLSIWLVYRLWQACSKVDGQESSTRYIRFDAAGVIGREEAGIDPTLSKEWDGFLAGAFERYAAAAGFWEAAAKARPELLRLDPALLASAEAEPGGKASKQIDRMRRNFVFDRARYWIPAAAKTNAMMLMSARDWADLCKELLADPLAEARALGEELRSALGLSAPRLLRHARLCPDWTAGRARDVEAEIAFARAHPEILERDEVGATVEVLAAERAAWSPGPGEALVEHPHRYSWTGESLKRWMVRFSLPAVALAEARDLNRHRTGYKWSPAAPTGFYAARDQIPADLGTRAGDPDLGVLAEAAAFGVASAARQRDLLLEGRAEHVYFGLLGTQYFWEHGTTLDKLTYEIELRTGLGAHYRYADHMRRVFDALAAQVPDWAERVLVGSAEPE